MSSIQSKLSVNDEWFTPDCAVDPIVKYLKPKSRVWCPFDTTESNYVKVLEQNGFDVIHTHISDGNDFFFIDPPKCDYIISNPPYSLKGKIFERLFDIGIPFAMLINFYGIFDNKQRFELFKDKDISIIFLYPRVGYFSRELPESKSVPFQSAYLCSGFSDKQIIFEYLKKEGTDNA
jgi:hypothetical protein